jgi:SulP family sulfate permease
MRASPACPWSPGFTPCCCRSLRSRSSVRPAILVVAADSATASSSPVRYPAWRAGQRAVHGAGRHGGAADRRDSAALARIFKLGFLADFLSRTVLVGVSHRRRVSGRHRDAERHVRRRGHSRRTLVQAWEVLQGLPQPIFRHWRCPRSWRAASCSATASRRDCRWRCSPSSGRSRRARRSTSPSEASRSSVRSPGAAVDRAADVTWSEALALLPVAASCFVMIIAQSAATSRAFALRYHESVDENADILGLSARMRPPR